MLSYHFSLRRGLPQENGEKECELSWHGCMVVDSVVDARSAAERVESIEKGITRWERANLKLHSMVQNGTYDSKLILLCVLQENKWYLQVMGDKGRELFKQAIKCYLKWMTQHFNNSHKEPTLAKITRKLRQACTNIHQYNPIIHSYYIFNRILLPCKCLDRQYLADLISLKFHNLFIRLPSYLQSMQNQNTTRVGLYPQDRFTLTAVTWNLFASLPPINSLVELSRSSSFSPPPDIICIATQQCQRPLVLTLCCESKEQWEAMLTEVFSEYYLAAASVMRGLHTAVLVRSRLRNYFSLESSGCLKAGTCGIMGNKGAISTEITLFGQPVQIINCHLAPHQNANDKRNQVLQRVLQETVKQDPRYEVIFLGDFNYRIEMSKEQYQNMIAQRVRNTDEERKYSALLHREQLHNQRELKADFLTKFQEGRITFPPTYKIGVNDNEYNRERIPGWTDRIFCRRKRTGLQLMSYLCEYNILGCDHRPVIARYTKLIATVDTLPPSAVGESNCQLI